MENSVEWLVCDLLPSIMPNIKANIDMKNSVSKHFYLSDNEPDKLVCSAIASYHKKGIGLERIKDTGLHTSLAHSFKAMLSLGIDLKTLGK